MFYGELDVGQTLTFKFTTRSFSTGAPATLSGTPALSVYKAGSTTESTAGVTLTADYDSRTGMNNVVIDTSADGTFYSTATDFDIVITTGTVGGVSVVGEVVGHFSIRNRAGLYPTTAGRTLDVSAGGEAGVDWANVGSPTTTLNLSGTTIKTATDVEADTADIQTRLPAALVNSRIDCTIDGTGMELGATAAIWNEFLIDPSIPVTARSALLSAATSGLGSFEVDDASASTTVFDTTLPLKDDNWYSDYQLQWTDASNPLRVVASSTTVGGKTQLTLDEALPDAPIDEAPFVLTGPHTHSIAQIQAGLATAAALATAQTDISAILLDTGTDGVVVAAASKAGYSLTAGTGLGNQTANITGNLSGSVGSVTGAVGSVTGNVGGSVGSVVGAVGSVTGNVGGNVAGSVGSLTLGQVIPMVDVTSETTVTLGRALLAALVQGAGSWSVVGTTLTLLNPDGSTFREFTLDSAVAPTSRT